MEELGRFSHVTAAESAVTATNTVRFRQPFIRATMDTLALTCWVRSGNDKPTFLITISKTCTVQDFQDAIKNKNKNAAAFRDVDALHLVLYKPKDPVPRPYKENLRKFILSDHAERLEGPDELSEVFLAPPPKHMIHVIVGT